MICEIGFGSTPSLRAPIFRCLRVVRGESELGWGRLGRWWFGDGDWPIERQVLRNSLGR